MVIFPHERKMMEHALGLDQAKRPYRNRFITRGSHPVWERLVSIGMAANPPLDTKTDQQLYAVTDAGIAVLGIALMPDDLEPSERYAVPAAGPTQTVTGEES